ncbi:MAG: hypothetical protein ACI3VS_00240 [Evtepia sp.]
MNQDETLQNRMKHRQLSHAYLVVGENRRTLADTLAAAWVCTGTEPPCGRCAGCRKAAQGIHPDILRADPEGEGLKAEAVRTLRSDAYIRPNEAPKKVYILEHGELLNQTGQNILLKLIEEGPAYACFLFLAPNPEMVLPTIRSRCETLRAPGPETEQASAEGEQLAELILSGAGPEETLPFLISLEKKDREAIALLLEETRTRLVRTLPQRPELLAVLEKLSPIRAACEFNISAGHLAGWIASVL